MKDLTRTEAESLINELVLNERDRKILRRRMLDGICFEPLAEEFHLSVRQTKNIVYKAQKKIYSHLDCNN